MNNAPTTTPDEPVKKEKGLTTAEFLERLGQELDRTDRRVLIGNSLHPTDPTAGCMKESREEMILGVQGLVLSQLSGNIFG